MKTSDHFDWQPNFSTKTKAKTSVESLPKQYNSVLPPPKLWGAFLVLKNFLEGGWHFFHFKVGGGSPYGGGLAKIGCKGGIQLLKIELYTFLSFSQFSKIV